MKLVSRKIAWKVMRETFQNYDKRMKASLYFVVALFTLIVALLLILDRSFDSIIIASNTFSIIAIGICFGISFDSLRASLAENENLRQKLLDHTRAAE